MEDSKIIELFFERSEQAISELSVKYGVVCRKVADNILNNSLDSEECVNDAFLAVWNTVPPQKPDPLQTYVCAIVRNLALKKYHENSAKKRNSIYDVALEEIGDCIPAGFSVEDEITAKETASLIDRFLGALDRESRIMFIRRYWFADPIEDIASLFGRSSHYISVKLSRIRKALRQYLKKEGVSL